MNFSEQNQTKLIKTIVVLGAAVSLFLVLLSINSIVQLSQGPTVPPPTNTITVSGTGDAFAIPDVATFDFSVTETATAIADAQAAATTKTNAAIAAMTAQGVANSDIQTTAYNINPHYEYTGGVCNGISICTPSKSTLTGYDVSQTIEVKVRDLTKAGTLLQAIGNLGVQNVDGLQFSIDNPDSLQDQARSKAITNAETKAAALAKELGVRLVRIVNFSEDNGNVVEPMVYSAKVMSVGATNAVAPSIPSGQQKITSDVSVTYEIK